MRIRLILVGSMVLLYILYRSYFDIYVVQKNSMENTLFHGDIMVVKRFYYNNSVFDNSIHSRFLFKNLFPLDTGNMSVVKRNDIIIFQHKNGTNVVKRCLAEPQDKFLIISDTIIFLSNKILKSHYLCLSQLMQTKLYRLVISKIN